MKYRITADGVLETRLAGFDLINFPMLNKGTAFTEKERTDFVLHGLLPPHVGNLEDQATRRLKVLRDFETGFERYAYLRDLQDTNETLFYSLLVRNIEEMMPLVYTPTVGEGCQRFSEIWRKPRGLFLSYPNQYRIREILAHPRYDAVRAIVVSDGERILGLGDQGAGGMGIPIGKLSLYTACAGIHPQACLPVLLDVGTDNVDRLEDPLYIGWRHQRVRGAEYDDFVEAFVSAVIERWPHVLLQWEDFAGVNAGRLLERYRDRLCTFNDDIQGTAAVATGTLLCCHQRHWHAFDRAAHPAPRSGLCRHWHRHSSAERYEECRPQRIRSTPPLLRRRQRWSAGGRHGGHASGPEPFAQPRSAISNWQIEHTDRISLLDVVKNAKPTTLIGVSGQAGAFTEDVIRAMAAAGDRPVIFPLSNPTSRSEATPADLLKWTEGRALIGTGSPFAAVKWNDREVPIDQTNNAYIFPGMGLGILSVDARRVTDRMFMAAAKSLAELSPARSGKSERLLPPISELRAVSWAVAKAVAIQAIKDGVACEFDEQVLESRISGNIWEPTYLPYRSAPCP